MKRQLYLAQMMNFSDIIIKQFDMLGVYFVELNHFGYNVLLFLC